MTNSDKIIALETKVLIWKGRRRKLSGLTYHKLTNQIEKAEKEIEQLNNLE